MSEGRTGTQPSVSVTGKRLWRIDPLLLPQQIDVSFSLMVRMLAAAVFRVSCSHRENGIQLAFVVQGHLNRVSYTWYTGLAMTL